MSFIDDLITATRAGGAWYCAAATKERGSY